MDNLKEVLQSMDKSSDEIEEIMQRIQEGMYYEGKSEVEVLTEVFGDDVNTLLKILGEPSSA